MAPSFEPYPPKWMSIVTDEADLERAFAALAPLTHFHSEVLRALVRIAQYRPGDARGHLDRAEALYERDRHLPRAELYYVFLRLYRFDVALIEEARAPDDEALERATDEAILAFLDLEVPRGLTLDQLRIKTTAHYKLIRGELEVALEAFDALLAESRFRFEDNQAGFHIGAAAALMQLGRKDEAEHHYESASLCLAALASRYKIALNASKLAVLASHWGRADDAESWLARIRSLEIPQATKRAFVDGAALFAEASRARASAFLPA